MHTRTRKKAYFCSILEPPLARTCPRAHILFVRPGLLWHPRGEGRQGDLHADVAHREALSDDRRIKYDAVVDHRRYSSAAALPSYVCFYLRSCRPGCSPNPTPECRSRRRRAAPRSGMRSGPRTGFRPAARLMPPDPVRCSLPCARTCAVVCIGILGMPRILGVTSLSSRSSTSKIR
jgi:hypothetical protein